MMGIMKLIFNQPRGKWPDELIKVVWSLNTTTSRSTGFTSFKLLFGDEAITPEEAKAGVVLKIVYKEYIVIILFCVPYIHHNKSISIIKDD
jgi:hypothetical protein